MLRTLLTVLRDKKTPLKDFRRAADLIADILVQEAAKLLPVQTLKIDTPLGKAEGYSFEEDIILVPILRGGLALLPAFIKMFPEAKVGFAGLRRDETTAVAELYYCQFPNINPDSNIFILDPMIATGGSGYKVIQLLLERGADPKRIYFAGIVAAPEGLDILQKKAPDVKLIILAIDEALNAKKFIVPGLGDFGDRYFGI